MELHVWAADLDSSVDFSIFSLNRVISVLVLEATVSVSVDICEGDSDVFEVIWEYVLCEKSMIWVCVGRSVK